MSEGVNAGGLVTFKAGLMQKLFSGKLRFARVDGRQFPDWVEISLGEAFENRVEKDTSGLPIYAVTQRDGMVPRESLDRDFGGSEEVTGYRRANAGDLVYNTMRMWQGAVAIAPVDCAVSPAYVILNPRAGIVSEFFAYWLKEPGMVRRLKNQSYGLTEDRLRLYYHDFANIRVLLPHSDEQRKIADALLTIDGKIAALTKKLGVLEKFRGGGNA